MRLSPQQESSEIINRDKPISFTWNNRKLQAYSGDSLASALLANDIKEVGVSFKYGRKRGIYSAWSDEPNAIATIEVHSKNGKNGKNGKKDKNTAAVATNATPNVRATEAEVFDGMSATAVAKSNFLGLGFKSLFKPLSSIMSTGFYYKTFISPQFLWPYYEKMLRRLSGFSPLPNQPDTESYDAMHHHCDVLIVGGGIAGLATAKFLLDNLADKTDSSIKLMLIDDRPTLGGQFYTSDKKQIEGKNLHQWVQDTTKQIKPKCKILTRTTAYSWHNDNLIVAAERLQDHLSINERDPHLARQRQHKIRAKYIIFATGAYERMMAFAKNDIPGIMLASAVHSYLKLHSVLPIKDTSQQIVIACNNDGVRSLVDDLIAAGCTNITLVDSRHEAEQLKNSLPDSVEYIQGMIPLKAKGSADIGKLREGGGISTSIKSLVLSGTTKTDSSTRTIKCDLLALSFGYDPIVHLTCHRKNYPQWSEDLQCFLPKLQTDGTYCVGAVDGYFRLDDLLSSAAETAQDVLKAVGAESATKPLKKPNRNNLGIEAVYFNPHTIRKGRGKKFVDMQNDATTQDIDQAVLENYKSVEHLKRYTAIGYGNDQGKTSNVISFNYLAHKLGLPVSEIGTTSFRPPYTPVTFGTMAGPNRGRLYEPYRYSPQQPSHFRNQAEWERVAQWLRPSHFPYTETEEGEKKDTMQSSLNRESWAARNTVAMMDASALGKIDVRGPDAREFLNRVYTNSWGKLAPGRCRYGLMLDENGIVLDDGVTACIADDVFYMTTTSAGANAVYQWLEEWLQTEWQDLKVFLTSVTDHWATTAVVGPKSREVLQKLCKDIDFSKDAFKFMDWRDGTVCGIPARIMRISFSGELAYEVNVQANYGRYVWDEIAEAGKEFGITPYGTETMHLLRAEKGFIIVGQDTDSFVTPVDLGMDWIMPKNKSFSYLGKRSLMREEMQSPMRPQLVGLLPLKKEQKLPEGCQLINSLETKEDMQGHVTSSYYSMNLGRSFSMALVKGGHKRHGETIYSYDRNGNMMEAVITEPVFYDKAGAKHNL